jgi:hypothetical protein
LMKRRSFQIQSELIRFPDRSVSRLIRAGILFTGIAGLSGISETLFHNSRHREGCRYREIARLARAAKEKEGERFRSIGGERRLRPMYVAASARIIPTRLASSEDRGRAVVKPRSASAPVLKG